MDPLTLDELRPMDLFDGLDDEQLGLWRDAAVVSEIAAGTILEEQGADSKGLHLILGGTVSTYMLDDGRVEALGENVAPTWIGAMATVTAGSVGVRMQASTDCRVATVAPDETIALVMTQRPVFDKVMAVVRPVMGRITQIEQNRERLAALGTMAAGLAHELNNPAAAARRASSDLAEALESISSAVGTFVESGVEREEAQALVDIQRAALQTCSVQGPLSALDAADREDELSDALDDLGITEAWKLTEALAYIGADAAWLQRVNTLAGPATQAALQWIVASVTARQLAAQLGESTDRMSHLVGAVKSYAYMDRGDVVEVDVHEGLETTITILGHKFRHASVTVERAYDRALPKITVHGSELNQVWTNLLDNAIDAAGEGGTVTVTTRREADCVVVEVADDGPGVPDDVRDRIFEPFFTTKEVGHGTGLGLDAVRRIVTERHRGSIAVDSEPGRTVFRVWLPIDDTTR